MIATELCITTKAVIVPLAYVVEVKLVEREEEQRMLDKLQDIQLVEILTNHGTVHIVDVNSQQFLQKTQQEFRFTTFLEKWIKSISAI